MSRRIQGRLGPRTSVQARPRPIARPQPAPAPTEPAHPILPPAPTLPPFVRPPDALLPAHPAVWQLSLRGLHAVEVSVPRRTPLPRVLLLSDVPGWAFDQNQRDLEHALRGRLAFDHWYVFDHEAYGRPLDNTFDAYYAPFHRWAIVGTLPKERTISALRSQWVCTERPGPPTRDEIDLINSFRAYQVCTQSGFDDLRLHCPGVMYLTNPVNMERFPEPTPVDGELIASWNGNAQHRTDLDVKGFDSIVQPACTLASVPLVFAEYHTRRLPPRDMPAFYQRASVALCASMYEGASNSVMEAMAAGQALVSTPVGNVPEMRASQIREFGETGILIVEQRTVGAFAEVLSLLKRDPARVRAMGEINRAEIEARWSWRVWADRYESFLRRALRSV